MKVYRIFILLLYSIFVLSDLNSKNQYINNIENMNFRRFMGKWNVYYTNIYKTPSQESKHSCLSFYYYFDDSKQFMYKFSKKDNNNNLIEKNGIIHIKDLNNNHIWDINHNNKNDTNFSQTILYVDPNYRLAIISDNKKEKIDIIGRVFNNDLKNKENIKYILNNNNLPLFEYFTEINHDLC